MAGSPAGISGELCACVVAGLDIILYIFFLQRLPMFFNQFYRL